MTDPSIPALSPKAERRVLYTLAAVQFTHVMDFMIMMPLGAMLMPAFQIGPEQFSHLVAIYGLAAAVTGFLGGLVIDRMDRKRALTWLYAGFAVATLACALAPSYGWLLLARTAAGAFGGLASSVVGAIVGDVVPPERRGRGLGIVMSGFPLASVLGVPIGLILADRMGWHAPFFMLAALSTTVLFVAARSLPQVASHRSTEHPVRQMIAILTHPIHQRCFLLSAVLIFGGAVVVPFMAPSLVANATITTKQLPWIYAFGGICTFFTTPLLGRLSDRYDKLHVLAGITLVAIVAALIVTNLPATPLFLVIPVTTLFFIGMSGRFTPTTALVANAVESRFRGGFMSVNSAIQQASAGTANLVAGLLVTTNASGHLTGYWRNGLVSIAAFILTLVLAVRVRTAAPHAARTPVSVAPAGAASLTAAK